MSGKEGRTEAPTEKRKKESRRKGQVAKSPDLAAWLGLLVGTYLLPATVTRIFDAAAGALRTLPAAATTGEADAAVAALADALRSGFLAIVPTLLVIGAVGVAAQLAQTRLLVSLKLLVPDVKRINPKSGLKRLFSVKSLVETVKQLAKTGAITWVAWPYVHQLGDQLAGGGRVPLLAGVSIVGRALVGMVRAAAWTVLVIAVVEYGYQRSSHRRDLRMTKQEIREEMRQSEGDPHVKARIRSLQTAFARRRMMGDVPTADVVVTNPTHIAVALRYEPTRGGAPRVVAVGVGAVAAKIRARASEAGVPLVEAKPLARALWRACDVGDEIPAVLYEAVAKVLAFVRRLRGSVGSAGALSLPSGYQLDRDVLDAVPARRRRRRFA